MAYIEPIIVKFEYEVIRSGAVYGLIQTCEYELELMKREEAYFNDHFGKHSEVTVDLGEDGVLEKVPLPIIEYHEWFEDEFGRSFGYDPREFIPHWSQRKYMLGIG